MCKHRHGKKKKSKKTPNSELISLVQKCRVCKTPVKPHLTICIDCRDSLQDGEGHES